MSDGSGGRPPANHTLPRWPVVATGLALGLTAGLAVGAGAQVLTGTVVDATNLGPVEVAAVRLVDGNRNPVATAVSDSAGRYRVEAPSAGEYIVVVQRFGYVELESPLVAIEADRTYGLDFEMQPEPVGLTPITVTVRNEELMDWLSLEYGVNPASLVGFRILQGARLAEAKQKGENGATETLRWLYIPVRHGGTCVAVNSEPRAQRRTGYLGSGGSAAPSPGQPPTGTRRRGQDIPSLGGSCGSLYLDDRRIPNEHIDSIDMSSVAVVVTLPGVVRLYTYEFDWTFRRD